MRALIGPGLGIALILALAGCAERRAATSATAQAPLPSGTIAEGTVTVTATVEKIDLKTRRVTVRGVDGKTETITVPEEVRNLPQVKKGDEVVATYYERVAFEVKKAGTAEPGVAVAGEAGRAEPGEKPAGLAANAVTVTTTITAIDKTAGTATLTGPDGESTVVKVRNRANLDRVSTGDLVEIGYTEALAVSVEPAAR